MSEKPMRIALSWGASSDNVGVAGYRVYRNNTLVATVYVPGYTDSPPGKKGVSYTYSVVAYDAAGNVSAPSNAAAVRS